MFVFGIGSVRTLTERGARIHPKAKEAAVAKVVVVTSGKGGVGKTTTSASIAAGIAMRGYKTVVIDFDVGLRNLDLIMGCERRVVFDFVNVINGDANVGQALIKDKRNPNLFVLPASQTRDKEALTSRASVGCSRRWRTSSSTSSATRRPVSSAGLRWRCTLPTTRSS
jgi:Mrp family chromosome partitioning ATPase